MNKRAQSVIFDLFIALFIFVIITSILIVLWNRYNVDINDRLIQKEMLIINISLLTDRTSIFQIHTVLNVKI